MLELNQNIFRFFSQFSDLAFIWLLADGPIFFIPLFLAWLWLYNTFVNSKNERRNQLLHIFYACILWIIWSYIIKQFIDIERPESYIEQTWNLIMSSIPEKSFPSDHATVSFAFTVSLFYAGFKKLWYIFLPCIICMNLARIALWVHWPLDIIAGALLWLLCSVLFFTYMGQSKFVKNIDSFIIRVMKYIKLY